MRMSLSGVAETNPGGGCLVCGECHISAGRIGRQDRRQGHVEQQLPQVSIIGQNVSRPTDEKKGLGIVTMIRQALNLPQQWCAPSERGPSPAAGSNREDHQHGDPFTTGRRRRSAGRCRRLAPRLDHRVEGGDEIGDRRKSVIGVSPGSGHDLRQRWRDLWFHRRKIQQAAASRPRPGSRACCPGERPAAGEHLVEHRTQREDVRTSIDRLAADLLRRHSQRCRRRAIARSGR